MKQSYEDKTGMATKYLMKTEKQVKTKNQTK